MASCHLVPMISASPSEGRCSTQHPSMPFKVTCHQQNIAVAQIPALHTHYPSHPLFYLARAPKNNHPGHAPLLPIISLIYSHLSPTFPFLICLSSISAPLNCHCLPLSPLLFLSLDMFCCLFRLSSSLCLYLSIAHPCLLSSFLPLYSCPLCHMAKSLSLNSQPNLHYPTLSFHPLITHSAPLA